MRKMKSFFLFLLTLPLAVIDAVLMYYSPARIIARFFGFRADSIGEKNFFLMSVIFLLDIGSWVFLIFLVAFFVRSCGASA